MSQVLFVIVSIITGTVLLHTIIYYYLLWYCYYGIIIIIITLLSRDLLPCCCCPSYGYSEKPTPDPTLPPNQVYNFENCEWLGRRQGAWRWLMFGPTRRVMCGCCLWTTGAEPH